MSIFLYLWISFIADFFKNPKLTDLAKVTGLYHYNADRTGDPDHCYPIAGASDDLFSLDIKGKSFLLSMGDMKICKALIERIISMGDFIPTLIHPTAIFSLHAKIS